MSKLEELIKLREEMRGVELPLKSGANQLVFGVGNPESKILFVGEAPGFWEDQKGLPFVGNAGKLLDKVLVENGLRRKDVFITNVVHYRPPENRDPLPEEIESFSPYLDKIIEIIDPQVIVTLGRFSMAKFIEDAKISQIHGIPHQWKLNGEDITIIPMYHPAAALRNGSVLEQFKKDFATIPKVLKEK